MILFILLQLFPLGLTGEKNYDPPYLASGPRNIITLPLVSKNSTNLESQNQVTDVDGNLYKTVRIGDQVWFSENLKVSHYRNGDSILSNLPDSVWMESKSGSFTIYNNDPKMDNIFGKLYNWYAVADPRGLCPVGWHVPSHHEWRELEIFLGLEEKGGEFFKRHPLLREIVYGKPGKKQNVGGKMKSVGYVKDGTGYWKHKPNNETNESGFSGLPGGAFFSLLIKSNDEYKTVIDFRYYGNSGFWWSSTGIASNLQTESKKPWQESIAWFFLLDEYKRPYDDCMDKYTGMSVRCLKD